MNMNWKDNEPGIKIASAFLALLLCLSIGNGCRAKKMEISPELASSSERLYKEGVKYIKKNPDKARLYLRQVIDSYPKDFYAQQAKLAIADSYFEKGDEGSMILAASEYREFISLFPYSPSAPYAQYRIAMTYFKKAFKPGRDQTKTRQALGEFKRVLTLYPTSEEAKLSQEKILACEERLAAHTFQIGLHYYRVSAYRASTNRLKEILTNFPNYSGMDRVYYFLADSYFKGKNIPQAIPYFTKVVSDYPESKFAKKAKKRLEEIDKLRKESEKKEPMVLQSDRRQE